MSRPLTEAAIIAHGQPGDPAPLQAQIDALAVAVTAELPPGWVVHGATLACGCSIRRAARARIVYPLFMAEGWFTREEMPRRLAMAGASDYLRLPPLGLDPALPALGARLAQAQGLPPEQATLVVVGHGSQKSRGSAEATRAFAAALAPLAGFRDTRTAFIEEPPTLADLTLDGPAVCLPFFATAASHTTEDIPAAWAALGAPGPITPAIGLDPAVPALIAKALHTASLR